MAIEHSLFALCVAVIEMSSIFVLIVNEPNIAQILNGHPLIAAGTLAFTISAGARAILIVWTIAHSYLSGRKLPPLFKSFQTAGAILVAEKLLRAIDRLGETEAALRFRQLYKTGVQLYRSPRRAPRKKYDAQGKVDKTYDRHAEQETLDKAHENELIQAFEDLENDVYTPAQAVLPFTFEQVMEAIGNAILGLEGRVGAQLDAIRQAVEVVTKNVANAAPSAPASTPTPTPQEVPPGAPRRLAEFTVDSPEFEAYELPNDVYLDTTEPVQRLADILGLPNSTLAKALAESDLPKFQRRPDQPNSVRHNYAVWEVLALVECSLLRMPTNVRKAEEKDPVPA